MKTSEAFALDSWLSYYPDGMTYVEIIDAMTDREQAHKAEHIDVWEMVESEDYSYIAQLIEDARVQFEQALRGTGLEAALRELLDYTGGSDITDENHPIYKARKALEKVQA
jgi:hypothetical protein